MKVISVIEIDHFSLEILFKLGIAALLSLIIGIERELKKKPVGLKTSLVIATFSCLLTIISIETAYSTPTRDDINITMDPLRLAAQIVSGIGFLGAGVILRKGNDSITGLTTAAMIWGAAAIGIAVGAGFYIQAFFTVLIVVIGVELLAPFLIKIGPKRLRMKEVSLTMLIEDGKHIDEIFKSMKENGMFIESVSIKDSINGNMLHHELFVKFSTEHRNNTLRLYKTMHALPYIKKVEIEYIA